MKIENMVKKGLVLLTAASVLFCAPSARVLADEPQQAATLAFISTLEEKGLTYTYDGADDNGSEMIYLGYTGESFETLDFEIFINEDGDYYQIYAFNLGTPTIDTATVYETMNELNSSCRFATFYMDSDNTIVASCSGSLTGLDDTGENIYDTFDWLRVVVDDTDTFSAISGLQ